MPSQADIQQGQNRLLKAADYYINVRDGVVPPPGTEIVDEQMYPKAAELLAYYDATVAE